LANAIAVLNRYTQLFPKSPRLAQVTFSLAQANLLGGHPADAIPLFTSLLPLPDYHIKSLLLLVEANVRANKSAEAISLLENERAQPNLDPDFLEKMNMRLLPLYLDAGSNEKAVSVLQQMDANILHVADVTAFNALAVKLGDLLLTKNDISSALACYRRVRDNEQIIALQKQQIENLKQQRVANLARIQANPLNSNQLQQDNNDIDAQIAKDQEILTKYQTLPPVLPPLFLRVARAYSMSGSRWESATVYHEILRRYPQCAEAEAALYGSVVIFDQLKRIDRAQGLCQTYLTQYPKGHYADSVGFLRGALAYDAQDYDKATEYFEDSLKNQPTNPRREQTEVILGDIQLQTGKFDDAIASYQKYEKEFPQGQLLEKAQYRSALALLFGGKADDAATAINAYLQKYPKGDYAADGEYRLDVIKFAGKQYDQVIADCVVWQQKQGMIGELSKENSKLQTWISYLSVIGVCSPMIGLLGTVTGMIRAFATLGASGIGDPSSLSSAIGEVLVATASGLFIAIPAFMAFYFLRNRATAAMHHIQDVIASLFRKMPYESMAGVHIGDDVIFAAQPSWLQTASVTPATE